MRGGLRLGALALATAGLVEYALQILLPIILVRRLTATDFGDYRLVWLISATAVPIFVMSLPHSLFYFLPGADDARRGRVATNALLFHCVVGACFFLFSLVITQCGLNFASLAVLYRNEPQAALFIALWIAASLLDTLPTADARATWQAKSTVFFAVLRTITLGGVVLLYPSLTILLWAMCAFALSKLLALPYYLYATSVPASMKIDWRLLRQQLVYAVPFGISNCFFLLRAQADQWVVAANFPPEVFALISIAAVVLSISNLVRLPINHALLPDVRTLIVAKNLAGASVLLAKGYAAVSLLLLPLLGLFIATANEVVELVYTRRYGGAASLMQVYLAGQIAGTFAAGHLLVALEHGRLAVRINAVCLGLSVVLSIVGIHLFGLIGAPLGSVISLVIGESWALHTVALALRCHAFDLIAWQTSGRMLVCVALAVAATLLYKSWVPAGRGPTVTLMSATAIYALSFVMLLPILRMWASFASAAHQIIRSGRCSAKRK